MQGMLRNLQIHMLPRSASLTGCHCPKAKQKLADEQTASSTGVQLLAQALGGNPEPACTWSVTP